MNRDEIHIRPANPTQEHASAFARYMDIASEGGFRKLFGKRYDEIVASAYLETNHDLSYETALFVEKEGRIVGMASGYSASQFAGFDQDALLRAASPRTLRIKCALAMMSPMLRFLHTYQDGDYYLEFLAVDEACRGQGIGTALIAAIEARAREVESTQLAIDVSARNPNARRLYERQGFVLQNHWPRLRILPTTILRMVKPL